MSAPLLELTDVRKEFPARGGGVPWQRKQPVVAVAGVTIQVNEGETLGIVGESGSGKTTMGRMMANLATPTSGRVALRGEDLSTLSDAQARAVRRNVQMIFQNPVSSLSPRRTVLDSLVEPMKIFRLQTPQERVARAHQLLEEVGLRPEYAQRYPHEFSGGQCQRICIARALMLQPDLIVCDEPVSALDVSVQAQVLNLLLRLQREHSLTYVFISHDLNVVRYCCDRIVVMRHGEVVEEGPAEQVYDSPQHAYTKQLLSAIPGESRERWASE